MAGEPGANVSIDLTVEFEGARRDLTVEAGASTSVGSILLAVTRSLPQSLALRDVELAAIRERDEVEIDPRTALANAGLRDGDVVIVRPASAHPTRAAAKPYLVSVTTGPDSGKWFDCDLGEFVVGRDPGRCELILSDPKVSGRHMRLVLDEQQASVVDLGSTNGTFIDRKRLARTERKVLGLTESIRIGDDELRIHRARPYRGRTPAADGSVSFNRPPRSTFDAQSIVFELPRPPDDWHRPRLPLGTILVPTLFGGALALFTQQFQMLGFALLTPVMAAWSFIEERRYGGRESKEAIRNFRDKVRTVAAQVGASRTREVERLLRASPGPAELVERARSHSPDIWDRRPGDSDFLCLRLGLSSRPSAVEVRIPEGGSDVLRAVAERDLQRDLPLQSVPIDVDLKSVGSIGVCGERERTESMVRWMLTQLAVRHSPRDVAIAAAVPDDRLDHWEWLKWLPHTHEEASPLAPHLLTSDPHQARTLLDAIVALGREREQEQGRGNRRIFTPTLVVFVDGSLDHDRALASQVAAFPPELGIASIWLEAGKAQLLGECRGVAEVSAALAHWTTRTADKMQPQILLDALASDDALDVGRALAPLRDTTALRKVATIPRALRLSDVIRMPRSGREVLEAWRASDGRAVSTVGQGANGSFEVDIEGDGPHGLVAGTSGAGKSEFLQTFIASLALRVPPDRVAFLLVDYKGGSAFRECVELPHTVGLVTDLDSHLTERALTSLNAELKRRERILASARAKDLRAMREAGAAPPSLIIVIDEFAALAREHPDFIEGIVDIAQRGRSLGIHLVLATQHPAGVVTANIRANTNLRIALRVTDRSESEDIISAPQAAAIPKDLPGRAFARSGPGDVVEFQSAHAGAPAIRDDAPEVLIREFGFNAPRAIDHRTPGGEKTELSVLVEVTREAALLGRLERPAPPWLPPLPTVISLDDVVHPRADAARPVAVIGLADEPSLQRQRPAVFDLAADGNLIVYGASGSGKTTLLRTIAMSLAAQSAPDELQIYGIDFATGGLKCLEPLPHCGSVLLPQDEERVIRLVRMLLGAIDVRRRLLAASGVSDISELSPEQRSTMPRLLLLLNGYAALATSFESPALIAVPEALLRVAADGRHVGVHMVLTAHRRADVPGRISGSIPKRVVLRMADEDEYAALGITRKQATVFGDRDGRGLVDDDVAMQACVVGADSSARGQAEMIASRGAELRSQYGNLAAAPIGQLPEDVNFDALPQPTRPLQALFGIRDSDLQAAELRLDEGHVAVIGPYRGGRSTALASIARSLHAGAPTLELHLLAPRRSQLTALDFWSTIAEGSENCASAARRLASQFDSSDLASGQVRVVVVIDDGDELLEGAVADDLLTVVRRGRDHGVRVIAAFERHATRKAYGGWFAEIRKDGRAVLLQPDLDLDGDLFGVRLPRPAADLSLVGRGFVVGRGAVELVQVARAGK